MSPLPRPAGPPPDVGGEVAGRALGVDLGEVRVGLALSDPDRLVATALGTLDVSHANDAASVAAAIAEVAEQRQAALVVVGLPRSLSGREGRAAQHAREVARHVEDRTGLDVEMWDERFSTVEAERVMIEGGTRRRQRRQAVDRVAATLVLQTYLDARRRGTGGEPG